MELLTKPFLYISGPVITTVIGFYIFIRLCCIALSLPL